jgi:hypothetical protein
MDFLIREYELTIPKLCFNLLNGRIRLRDPQSKFSIHDTLATIAKI